MRERTRSPAMRVAAALFLSFVAACGEDVGDLVVPLPADFEAWDTMIVEAVRTAADALEAEPREADRWLKLGFVYHGNLQHELALPCYERALELDDESADGWYGLAILRADRGDFA
ncbi:MAG: tetratricopeptide repeat protein, partial [Planctomycetota bacterium]|nr:tetratricopeptide repeat protein [Planctomycetota bacterium]